MLLLRSSGEWPLLLGSHPWCFEWYRDVLPRWNPALYMWFHYEEFQSDTVNDCQPKPTRNTLFQLEWNQFISFLSLGEGILRGALLENLGLCWVIWGVIKEVELRSLVWRCLEDRIIRLGIWIHLNWEGDPTEAEAVTDKDTAVTSLLE